MNIEHKDTKKFLKGMPVFMAEELLDLYKIKSPYKEILIATCVKDLHQFEAMEWLNRTYNINISFRTFTRKHAIALERFRTAHTMYR